MGVLTDFVIANRSDAQKVCDSACPARDFSGLDAKGFDPVKLGTLYAIVIGADIDPSTVGVPPLATGGDEGPWVTEVPPHLVEQLARLDAKRIAQVANDWAKTDEFSPQYDHWPLKAVHDVLDDLARLCVRAAAEKKSVLMWMSL